MCSKLVDNINLFNVSGVPIKITTQKLAKHPESLLTTMVHNKVQPIGGWFVECCPKIFGYILRFVVHDIQIDPLMVADKLGTSEASICRVIDSFKFNGIYVTDSKHVLKAVVVESYKNIWNIAERGNMEILRLIVDHGYDIDIKCPKYGSTPLMYAVQAGHLDCVNLLIDHGANVTATNNIGNTALHFSVESHKIDIVKLLIKNGANINAVTSTRKRSPLHRAFTRYCNTSLIIELINNGADINIQDDDGKAPLHFAMEGGLIEVASLLISKGAHLNAKTNAGNTPLHIAAITSLVLVEQLLQLGVDANIKNNNGDTPLLCASKAGKHDIVATLCEYMYSK